MSASANTQIHVPRPKLWQAFEKGSAELWRKILNDPSLHRFGRNGQAQHGIDMYGYRDGDPGKVVGVQCKCKGLDEQATEAEFRKDFSKALKHEPKLSEYFFTTTAPDDASLQTFAAKLTEEQRLEGRNIIVRAWGWGTLEDEISAYPDVAVVFDPNHSPTAEIQAERHLELLGLTRDGQHDILAELRALRSDLTGRSVGDATSSAPDPAELALDKEIDRYRDRANNGKPRSALDLFQDLLKTLTDQNSGHIWFRVKANIAHCHLKLGNETAAADVLEEAIAHAPDDPKAAANVVLAMMLRGKHREAWDLALIELAKTPDNEGLAGYAVQAAGYANIENDLSYLPEALLGTEAVKKHHLINVRNAGDPSWADLANQGLDREPEDEFYRRQAADAGIQAVVEGDHRRTWVLKPEDRAQLRRAADDLIALWKKARDDETPERPDNLALCINATLALIALGEGTAAKDLILDGLAISNGKDPDLIIRVAAIALEVGDKALAEEMFPKLAEDGVALQMRCQIAATYGDWDYLASIADSDTITTVPEPERHLMKALVACAVVKQIAKSDQTAAAERLDQLISEYAASGRASVLIAQIADDLGLGDASSRAYANSIVAINENSHIASRTMVANYAARRRDFAAVIRLMDGHLDARVESPELFDLACAFAYEFPPRARAVSFFASLPDDVRQSPKYVLLEGIMHYHRGDLGLAEERFSRARELTPDQIRPLLMQVQTLFRLKRKGDLPKLVKELDPALLKGVPEDRIHLAQVLASGGRVDDALKLGFETLEENRNDPIVSLKWLGLSLGHLRLLHKLSDAPIGVGMWTRLVSNDGQTNEFLVVDGPGDPTLNRYGTSHTFAEAAIGHRVGDVVSVEDKMGRTTSWKVDAVRHKYLHAYEDLTEHFNTRFPEQDGFFVIRTIDDDVEPFLDIMRRQSEHRRQVLDYYANGPLPISAIVELSGGDVVRFADSLRIARIKIEACDGTHPERVHAIDLIEKFHGKGAVLDTLTYWAVVGFDGLETLKRVFGKVLLARSTADEIGQLIDTDQVVDGGERKGTAYFHDGQYYMDEMTPERERAVSDAVAKRESAMEADCQVVPVHAPEDIDPRITENLHRGALDPIFVARERGMLLVSDDMRFRQWAAGQNVPGVWLQAVFLYARQRRLIAADEYARLSAELAALNHASITCNAGDIIEVVGNVTDDTRYRMHAIADVIGTEKAEINSHLNVALRAIERLWGSDTVTLNAQNMTGLLIQNLIRHRPQIRNEVLEQVRDTLSNFHEGASYFDRWKVGHFIVGSPSPPPQALPKPPVPSHDRQRNRSSTAKPKARRGRK